MATENNPVSDLWARRIRAMWEWQQGFGGVNVRKTGRSVYIGGDAKPRRSREARPAPPRFLCRVDATTAISSGRWWYDLTQVGLSGSEIVELESPRTFKYADDNAALNGLEFPNDADGVQGNGVDLDGQIFTDNSGLEVVPIGGGALVEVTLVRNTDGTTTPMFFAPNAIDGECAAS